MSETFVVWALAAAVVAVIVLPYALAFRRQRGVDRARKSEARALGFDRPLTQFPFVDPLHCIGCGACVAACPEGDVLGVVGGIATVVNGMRCVGHGHCQVACPVGAIEVGLGDLKARSDVPSTDDHHETGVPGLFVVGELAGMGLVRNAVTQGRHAAQRVAQRARPGRGPGLDLIVVGAGPAGLATAAAAVEAGLCVVLLEQEADLGGTVLHYPRRKLVLTEVVELGCGMWLETGELSKEELLARLEELARRSRARLRFGARVEAIVPRPGGLAVLVGNEELEAPSVVLALGRRGSPRKLGVPGEERSKVMYRLIDAGSYAGQRVLVVGGGDSAIEAAVGLAERGAKVTLSYRRDRLLRAKQKNGERFARLCAQRKLEARFATEVARIDERAVVLRAASGEVQVANDYVFVLAGGEPPFELLRQAGVAFGGGQPSACQPEIAF